MTAPPHLLDLDLLRTFVAIVDCGGFTRAGERLNRTQSTVSLQVKRLETAIGRPLFERDGRTVRVTSDGELLLTYARRIIALTEEAHARLVEPEIDGVVRIGTPEDFATSHLPDVLARFSRSHPRVALDVRCDLTLHLLDGFAAGEFDVVLVKREPQGPDVGVRPGGGTRVWREPLVWAAGPATFEDGAAVPLVLSPHPCVYRKRALQALDESGRPWRIAYTSPSLAGVQAAVRAGLGATVLPKEMVPAGFRMLGAEHGFPPLADTEIALMRAPGALSKAAERLADHIVRSLEAASGGAAGSAAAAA